MASKRKTGGPHPKREAPRMGRKHRTGSPAGRVAVRREPAAPLPRAMDAHAVEVREQIDAALAEALRMREAIEQRIERRLMQPGVH